MQMDALHCYPHASAGMGGGVPITPPATPTQEMSRTPTFSSLSSCSQSAFAKHEFAEPEYAETQYSDDYSAEEYTPTHSLSPPESPMTTPKSTPTHTPTYAPNMSSPSSNSNSSSSSSSASAKKLSGSSSSKSRNRKNSFVYDVRLTDEQFLFFVPDFDLVKSHLMFAVREEVEVLKEKISELMERINQLEYENTVLRQYATQEALQQLQQPHHSSNT